MAKQTIQSLNLNLNLLFVLFTVAVLILALLIYIVNHYMNKAHENKPFSKKDKLLSMSTIIGVIITASTIIVIVHYSAAVSNQIDYLKEAKEAIVEKL